MFAQYHALEIQHAAALRVETEQGLLLTIPGIMLSHVSSVKEKCSLVARDFWWRAGFDHAELVLLGLLNEEV